MNFFYEELNKEANLNASLNNNNEDKEITDFINSTLPEETEIQGALNNNYESNPEDCQFFYGKLNKEFEKATYKGLNTETATTVVDNNNMTISVDIDTEGLATQRKLDALEEELKEYVDTYGGRIDNILLNDEIQPIQDIIIDGVEYKKAVNLTDIASQTQLATLEETVEEISEDITGIHGDIENIETELEGKQDTLIPGNNITIEDNVISADGATFDSVLLEDNLYTYANVGNIKDATPLNPVKIGEIGDSLTDVWEVLFGQRDEQPRIESLPSLSLSFKNYGGNSQEYGTHLTNLNYTLTKTTGSYTYDSSTGVSWLGDPVFTLNGNTLNYDNNYLDIDYIVGVNSTFNINVSQSYSDGNIAKTLLGRDSNPIIRITSSTATASRSFSITSLKYAYYGVTNTTNLPIDVNDKCTLTKRNTSGTSGTYTFNPSGQYLWLATPTAINTITWNGNLLTEGENEDYTFRGIQTIKLDTNATTTYYFYIMNGSKTGSYTYVVS